jgi:oxygen-independent coproporphyrinogen-3 oxidase
MPSPTAPRLSPPFETPSSSANRPRAEKASATPLALYFHWPYCESKCPYCDFNSFARRGITEEQYLRAALRELDYYCGLKPESVVVSIFFGGGTPSLMSVGAIEALLDRAAAFWNIDPACEITLEANPSSVEAGRFAGYRRAGVNRVSLGVQSLLDDQLRFLGRLHTAAEAKAAIELAAKHFERMSFDLIYARPGQSPEEWRRELSEALPLARGHLSLYQLTIEPGTAFFDLERRGRLRVPEADAGADLYELTQELCEKAGLPAYEISNHAAPGQECRHNLIYWKSGDYAGIGPGAHGRLTLEGERIATAAIKNPADWLEQTVRLGHGMASRERLSLREQAEERLLMGLRLSEGLRLTEIEAATGFSISSGEIEALSSAGLLDAVNGQIKATRQGRLVLNAIVSRLAEELIPSGARAQY